MRGNVRKSTFARKLSREKVREGRFTREHSGESRAFVKNVREGTFARERSSRVTGEKNVREGLRGSESSRRNLR